MKEAILKLLKERGALDGRQIGEVVDPENWMSHIHLTLEEMVRENKIIQTPPLAKMWDTYKWSLK